MLSRQQVERSLWAQGLEPESNALSISVNRLRDRLKQINADTWIDTIRGRLRHKLCSNFLSNI